MMPTKIHGLDIIPQEQKVRDILSSALVAAEPAAAVVRAVKVEGNKLLAGQYSFEVNDQTRVHLLGVGKASIRMAEGLTSVLGNYLVGGVVITKTRLETTCLPDSIQVLAGSHPVPDESSMESTKKLVQYLQNCEPKDIVFCLISGGGSSLMTLPAEGIHLSDIQALTRELLACGADIGEINTIRKHLDRVKGGGLARLNRAAHLITLILSDVIDSPLDVIASGPTVADNSSFQDAMDIITKYALENKISTNILRILQAGIIGEIPETVKENDPSLQQVNNILIGNNQISARAALEKAREFGFTSLVLTTSLRGEASHAGMILASILQEIAENSQPVSRPACLIFGGETTVTIRGTGLGGRNLEMALGAVEQLKGFENIAFITLATDGEDGSSGAAGAVVTGGTYNAGADLGYLPTDYLKANDSYHYFEKVGGLLITGSTGTNVNDLGFLFAF